MTIRELVTRIGFRVDERGLMVYDKAIGRVLSKTDQLFRNLDRVASSIQRVGQRLMLAVSLPLLGIGTVSLMAASNVESLQVSLTTMLKSADRANQLIQEMITFAEKTPFQLEQVQANTQMLIAMGFAADELIPTLNALGNIAAGTGGDLTRMALNLGQVRTQGKLTGRDLRDFQINRVPILEELAKTLGVATKEVRELVSEGKVGFDIVAQTFRNMTSEGGRFYGLMIARSQTLGGLWSNLIDATFKLRVAIGDMILETFPLRRALQSLIELVGTLATQIQNAPTWVKKLIAWLGVLAIALGPLLFAFGSLFKLFLGGKIALAIIGKMIGGLGLKLGVAAGGAALLAAKFLLIAAAVVAVIAAIVLLIDDIVIWQRGGDSLIGRFLKAWKKIWVALKADFSRWFSWWKAGWAIMLDPIKGLGKGIGDFFADLWDTVVGWFNLIKAPIITFVNWLKEKMPWLFKPQVEAISRIRPGEQATEAIARSMAAQTGVAAAAAGRTGVQIEFANTFNWTLPAGMTREQGEAFSAENEERMRRVQKEMLDDIFGVVKP